MCETKVLTKLLSVVEEIDSDRYVQFFTNQWPVPNKKN